MTASTLTWLERLASGPEALTLSAHIMLKQQIIKVLKGAGVAVAGALAIYTAQAMSGYDFGPMWTPILVAVASILANVGRKLLGL